MLETDVIYDAGPTRDDVDALHGPAVLNFGTAWCGFCQASAGPIAQALTNFPLVKYIGVEDGPGRQLGRSFRVKLWPTLIFLRDGEERARLVRSTDVDEIRTALRAIA